MVRVTRVQGYSGIGLIPLNNASFNYPWSKYPQDGYYYVAINDNQVLTTRAPYYQDHSANVGSLPSDLYYGIDVTLVRQTILQSSDPTYSLPEEFANIQPSTEGQEGTSPDQGSITKLKPKKQ